MTARGTTISAPKKTATVTPKVRAPRLAQTAKGTTISDKPTTPSKTSQRDDIRKKEPTIVRPKTPEPETMTPSEIAARGPSRDEIKAAPVDEIAELKGFNRKVARKVKESLK